MVDEPDLSGLTLGRYEIQSPLGAGGMGVVYDAIDTALARHVAVKVLSPDLTSDASRVRRFILEARSASSLNHPHVISIHEVGEATVDGRTIHFIAMDRIVGVTLGQAISSGTLSLRRGLALIGQVCDAIGAAHANGIVHRDLKPQNVMVSQDGYATVLDFGLAKLKEEPALDRGESDPTALMSTRTGAIVGTAGYMSPEQAQGQAVDHRTDVFAIGCMLYEVVTGHKAFRGDSIVDTLHRIVHSSPEPMASITPGLPQALQRIVDKALEKDPADRYQSAKDLAIDLRDVVEALAHERSPRPSSSAPALTTALIALAVVTFVVLIVVATRSSTIARVEGPASSSATNALKIERLTNTGDVINATISPDGKYLCYVTFQAQGQSLWLRQLATGQDLQLVPDGAGQVWGCTFTPDGEEIVYGLKSSSDPNGSFYRIATIGGPAELLLSGIDSPAAFSPDGKHLAWLRSSFPHQDESALMIANADGTDARPLAVRHAPELFSPIFFACPSWSPDGRRIAAVVATDWSAPRIVSVDVATGVESILFDRDWFYIGGLTWLPEGSAIVAAATDKQDSSSQLWYLPVSGDLPRRITHDVLLYRLASCSADGKRLVSVGADIATQIWSMPLDASARPSKLTDGPWDGWRGLAYLPDGRILFSTSTRLAEIDPDGSNRHEYDRTDVRAIANFVASGNLVAFRSWSGDVAVSRIDGTSSRLLVHNAGSDMAISSDGTWLAYQSYTDGRLWKIAVEGGEPVPLTSVAGQSPALSPTGDRIAFISTPGSSAPSITVVSTEGGRLLWSRKLNHRLTGRTMLKWTPDGQSLMLSEFSRHEVTFYSMDDTTRTLDDPAMRDMYSFDVSPSGKTLVFARGFSNRDAYLITGFR